MFSLIITLLCSIFTGGAHTYGAPGAPTQGVYVQVGPAQCAGYEFHGNPGLFGNVYGLRGGDCN